MQAARGREEKTVTLASKDVQVLAVRFFHMLHLQFNGNKKISQPFSMIGKNVAYRLFGGIEWE